MKIEFYVLGASTHLAALRFVCQLAEKSYQNQESIFIQCAHLKESEQLDQLMWTYRDDGFLPHHLHHPDSITECASPIHIGENYPEMTFQGVFFNLNPNFVLSTSHYLRLVEIVFPDPSVQQLARERYKKYQQQGHDIQTYKLKENDL